MYSEIDDYHGDFGDPVVSSFSFDPWNYVDCKNLSLFERRGVIVALLVNLMSAIDNSTHEEVFASREGLRAMTFMESNMVKEFPQLRAALEGFAQSEKAFVVTLRTIYSEWVQPTLMFS
jgi:hypothetical protein